MSKQFDDLPQNISLPDFYDLVNEIHRLGNARIAAIIVSCLEDHNVSLNDFLTGLSGYSFEIGCEEASGHLERAAKSLRRIEKLQNSRNSNH